MAISGWIEFGGELLAEYFRIEDSWDDPLLGVPDAGPLTWKVFLEDRQWEFEEADRERLPS